jgi:type I restriction enzyme, R subunit
MRTPHPDSEEALENAAIDLFKALDWETVNAQYKALGTDGTLGREKREEVVLVR